MADILEEIAQRTREDVHNRQAATPLSVLKEQALQQKPAISLSNALLQPGRVTVIAELKQASPSAGVIRTETDLPARVDGYVRGGASALSILTEEHYFKGSPQILEMARKRTTIPLLRKDFIVDHYQMEESRALGADAVLLITTLLGNQLKEFLQHAADLGMDALVELHNERDLEIAVACDARLLGVNNRNLRTLKVDPANAERLVPLIPSGKHIVVIESGVKDPSELPVYQRWGAHAVLIGETLMRDPDAEAIVSKFVQAGRLS